VATESSRAEILRVFELVGLPPPSESRLEDLATQRDEGRSLTSVRDGLIQFLATSQNISFSQALQNIVRDVFASSGVNIATDGESEEERLTRLADEIMSGTRTLGEVTSTIQSFSPTDPISPTPTPTPSPTPTLPDDPIIPQPDPAPAPEPSEPIDFRARAQALFPFLPPQLLDLYSEKWAESGDPTLALAEVRASPQYEQFFPGIKRTDGSLRMSESEYLSRKDGYRLALSQFNLNPANFENRFVEMIEGEVEVADFANRLSGAFENIITAMPEIREFYSQNFGVSMTDEAIFASFIDPELGDAVLNRRISISQIGGAGAASGFNIDLAMAEQIRQRGIGFQGAQEFFGQAATQIPVFNALAGRFGVDTDVDLTEFAAASIFGNVRQASRLRRLQAAEASSFSEQFGSVSTSDDFTLRGLRQR